MKTVIIYSPVWNQCEQNSIDTFVKVSSIQKNESYNIETTWEWVNIYFWMTYPFKMDLQKHLMFSLIVFR